MRVSDKTCGFTKCIDWCIVKAERRIDRSKETINMNGSIYYELENNYSEMFDDELNLEQLYKYIDMLEYEQVDSVIDYVERTICM